MMGEGQHKDDERDKKEGTRKVTRGKDTGMEQCEDKKRRSEKEERKGERGRMPPPPIVSGFWQVKVSLHCAITAAGDCL